MPAEAADERAAGKKAQDKKAAVAEKEAPAWAEALEQKMDKLLSKVLASSETQGG